MRRLAGLIGAMILSGALAACTAVADNLSAIPDQPDAYQVSVHVRQSAELAAGPAKAPSGFVAYCERQPEDCRMPGNAPAQVPFSQQTLSMLKDVNFSVNKTLQPIDDSAHYGVEEYWTVPVDGYGDCEDYALAKRKMLTLLGMPEPALRITVALSQGRIRHAVLTVVTDQGDLVLDNMNDDVLAPEKTDYAWIERQDPASRTGWVALN